MLKALAGVAVAQRLSHVIGALVSISIAPRTNGPYRMRASASAVSPGRPVRSDASPPDDRAVRSHFRLIGLAFVSVEPVCRSSNASPFRQRTVAALARR